MHFKARGSMKPDCWVAQAAIQVKLLACRPQGCSPHLRRMKR
jgi:hypothetical protein